MRASPFSETRLSAESSDHAKLAKLCITPLGMPVVPEVYITVESSPPSRTGSPASGAVAWMIASQDANPGSGAGGSCLGYRMAGFDVVWANELVPAAVETYRANHHGILDTRDIRTIQPAEVLAVTGLAVGELDLLGERISRPPRRRNLRL